MHLRDTESMSSYETLRAAACCAGNSQGRQHACNKHQVPAHRHLRTGEAQCALKGSIGTREALRPVLQCECRRMLLTWGFVSTSHLKYECNRSLGSRNLKFGLPACLTRSTNSVWPPDPRTNLAVCMMTCGAASTCQWGVLNQTVQAAENRSSS